MLKAGLTALLLATSFSANATEVKANVTGADRAAFAKMNGTQAFEWARALTIRTCPGVYVRPTMSRAAAIAALSSSFATFDLVVQGVEDACRRAIAEQPSSVVATRKGH